jgi:hypothetical protein
MTWFVLNTDNIWYGQLMLLNTMSVKRDGKEEPVDTECAYVSLCYEIKTYYQAGTIRHIVMCNKMYKYQIRLTQVSLARVMDHQVLLLLNWD